MKRVSEDPVFGSWYYLSLKFFFIMVVPGTKCSSKIFQKFFRSENKVIGPAQILTKKLFLNFFLRFFWGLFTGTKCEKVVLLGFGTGQKVENLIFILQIF
jgi:hypothetical protein